MFTSVPLVESFKSLFQKEAVKYAAGVAFTLALSLVFRLALIVNRKRMLRFFGISSRCPGVRIYLSQLKVETTTGLTPLTQGFTGTAGASAELQAALELRDLLKQQRVAVPRGWFGRRPAALATADPRILTSPDPARQHDVPHDVVVISLGSHVYNSLFRAHNTLSRCFRFGTVAELRAMRPDIRHDVQMDDRTRGILIMGNGTQGGRILTREGPDGRRVREYGVIERVNDPETHSTRFYCAGLGTSATVGCARYLAQHWKELYEDNGLDEFALYLMFPDQESEQEETVPPVGPDYIHRGTPPRWRLMGRTRGKLSR